MIQEVFNQFLRRFDSDRESNWMEYDTLHYALIIFFEQRGKLSPEIFAKETLNRVSKVLREGTKIENISTYTLAVARNLLRENWCGPPKGVTTITQQPLDQVQHEEVRVECMKRCLNKLPAEDYKLIRKYYITEYIRRDEQRKKLADQMGISLSALRDRIHYIRFILEGCLNDCLG